MFVVPPSHQWPHYGAPEAFTDGGTNGGVPFVLLETGTVSYDSDVASAKLKEYRKLFDAHDPSKVGGVDPDTYGTSQLAGPIAMATGGAQGVKQMYKVLHPDGKKYINQVVFQKLEPGYRSPVHAHPFAGITCVQKGAFHIWTEAPLDNGPEYVREIREAGHCYTIPARVKMFIANIGEEPVETWDHGNVPEEWGDNYAVVLEPSAMPLYLTLFPGK